MWICECTNNSLHIQNLVLPGLLGEERQKREKRRGRERTNSGSFDYFVKVNKEVIVEIHVGQA